MVPMLLPALAGNGHKVGSIGSDVSVHAGLHTLSVTPIPNVQLKPGGHAESELQKSYAG
jgi:hypothetical protein